MVQLSTTKLTGSGSEDGGSEPPPHVGDSLGEVVWESPLLKGRQTVCDHMSDLGQISKVATHDVRRDELI